MNAVPRDRFTPAELRQRLGVETPEHVELHFDLAGVGSRTAAAVLDTTLIVVGLFALAIAGNALGRLSAGSEPARWALAALILLGFLTFFGYFALFEALNGGRTPGKQALGIRVVMETGHAVTPAAAVVRNLVRLVDTYFPLPLLGLLMVFLHGRNQRLGDLAAGTIVLRERTGLRRPTPTTFAAPTGLDAYTDSLDLAGLGADEYGLVRAFLLRAPALPPAVRARLAAQVGDTIAKRVQPPPPPGVPAELFLASVAAADRKRGT
jgi:uncharacterized RDD family membrane protein YckC